MTRPDSLSLDPLPDRFAVLADVHGNSAALATVLSDVKAAGLTKVLLLGDHFSGPLDAAGCWDLIAGDLIGGDLVRSGGVIALKGNHDRYLLEQAADHMGPSDQVAHQALPATALDWLGRLPGTLDFGDVWACHAMPDSDERYWTHEVGPGGRVWPRPVDEIAAEVTAAGITASLILCAHTHLPVVLRLPTGQLLVNPGSVGCPAYDDTHPVPHAVEAGNAHAAWAEIRRSPAGWRVVQHFLPYDSAPMAARARAHGRWDWARGVETGFL